MSRSPITAILVAIAVALLMLPIAQAAGIELSDTCSLADAITAANTDEAVGGCPAGDGADTITLSGDITLEAILPRITSDVTIDGAGFTISGNNRYRIFANRGGTLSLTKVTLTRGSSDWGGAIANLGGEMWISESNLNHNTALEGGAIGNDGSITIVASEVFNNRAEIGGAIHSISGTLQVAESNISHNASTGDAGAVYHTGEGFTISSSRFENNAANESGGALLVSFTEETSLHINDSMFLDNEAEYNGGAISTTEQRGAFRFISRGGLGFSELLSVDSPVIRIQHSKFLYNQADSAGGAIHNNVDAGILITNCRFSYNSSRSGGALSIKEGHSLLQSVGFDHNWSTGSGGAVSVGSYTKLGINGSDFIGNSSGEEGGAIRISNSDLAVANSTFFANSGTVDGGAILVGEEGIATLRHITLNNNSADRGGGLFRSTDAQVSVASSIIANSVGGDCFGRLAQNINNLIADGSCFATLSGDPMLGELVEPEDGSPAYFPLLEGSPAIDAADDEYCPDTDIIGTPRPQGAGCDIGAYELPAR